MPCLVRRWYARSGMESHLRQALVRAHQDLFTRDDQGLESALYREHVEGREFLGLAIYDEEAALEGATRRALLDAFATLEAAYTERPSRSLRLTTVSEFVNIGRPVVSGMAALLRSAPASAEDLGERLKTISRQIVNAIGPSRLLVGQADDDPGLLVPFAPHARGRAAAHRAATVVLARSRLALLPGTQAALSATAACRPPRSPGGEASA